MDGPETYEYVNMLIRQMAERYERRISELEEELSCLTSRSSTEKTPCCGFDISGLEDFDEDGSEYRTLETWR